jgi:sRNA-binding protein
MTQKIYKSAQGKSVDFGALRLQNENVRAVGNMGVNARGDRIDVNGNVIDSVNDQLQRRIQRQTNVVDGQVHSSTRAQNESENAAMVAASPAKVTPATATPVSQDPIAALVDNTKTVTVEDTSTGLAAAIARSKTVKQELEKTALEKQQDKPVRKI